MITVTNLVIEEDDSLPTVLQVSFCQIITVTRLVIEEDDRGAVCYFIVISSILAYISHLYRKYLSLSLGW